jgi:hypothetical protein
MILKFSNNENANIDILSCAVHKNKLEIIKYLVLNGANPFENNMVAIKRSFSENKDDIFDFLISNISYDNLCNVFEYVCQYPSQHDNKLIKIKQLLNLGLNINDTKDLHENITNIVYFSTFETVMYLIDNGLNVSTDKLLTSACDTRNHELLDYLLSQGVQIHAEDLKIIFKSMNTEMINILIKHNIDLSNMKPINNHDVIYNLNNLGMDGNVLSAFWIDKAIEMDWDF